MEYSKCSKLKNKKELNIFNNHLRNSPTGPGSKYRSKALALHKNYPGLVPGTIYGSLSTALVTLKHRHKSGTAKHVHS